MAWQREVSCGDREILTEFLFQFVYEGFSCEAGFAFEVQELNQYGLFVVSLGYVAAVFSGQLWAVSDEVCWRLLLTTLAMTTVRIIAMMAAAIIAQMMIRAFRGRVFVDASVMVADSLVG